MSRIFLAAAVGLIFTPFSRAVVPVALEFDIILPELRAPAPQLVIPVLPLRPPRSPVPKPTMRPVLMLCGGGIDFQEAHLPAFGLIDLFGSAADFRLALGADTIEIVEVKAKSPLASAVLADVDAAALHASLTCDSTYDWDLEGIVEFRPEFRVKFKQKDKTVMMDLCLSSRMARLANRDLLAAPTSMEFGYSTIAAVIERYFPGATRSQ